MGMSQMPQQNMPQMQGQAVAINLADSLAPPMMQNNMMQEPMRERPRSVSPARSPLGMDIPAPPPMAYDAQPEKPLKPVGEDHLSSEGGRSRRARSARRDDREDSEDRADHDDSD